MRWKSALLILILSGSPWVYAYQSEVHQQVTFLAAKQISRCDLSRTDDVQVRLSALDTRYIVRSNMARADTNIFLRPFRWNYFSAQTDDVDAVLGMIGTRFNRQFERLVSSFLVAPTRQDRLNDFGALLSYIQDVTSPARVVPVFAGRWWRFSFGDRFERFPIDVDRLEASIANTCDELWAGLAKPDAENFATAIYALLRVTAAGTFAQSTGPIAGMPARWTAFWQPATKPEEFGSYGPAGNNFGSRTEFACAETRCLLLDQDPLYRDFAHFLHRSAVLATMRAMLLLQEFDPGIETLRLPGVPPLPAQPAATVSPIASELP